MHPLTRWPVYIIASGGLVGTIFGETLLTSIKSIGFITGLANPIIFIAKQVL